MLKLSVEWITDFVAPFRNLDEITAKEYDLGFV